MYSHTRKVGSLGRYGPRVGRKIRHTARKIEDEQHKPKVCPQCGKSRVERRAFGIWHCRSCNLSYAGGAYTPVSFKREVEQAVEEKPAVQTRAGKRRVERELKAEKAEAAESEERLAAKKARKAKFAEIEAEQATRASEEEQSDFQSELQ
jgi:large subunit ribosomal protein L37Ae